MRFSCVDFCFSLFAFIRVVISKLYIKVANGIFRFEQFIKRRKQPLQPSFGSVCSYTFCVHTFVVQTVLSISFLCSSILTTKFFSYHHYNLLKCFSAGLFGHYWGSCKLGRYNAENRFWWGECCWFKGGSFLIWQLPCEEKMKTLEINAYLHFLEEKLVLLLCLSNIQIARNQTGLWWSQKVFLWSKLFEDTNCFLRSSDKNIFIL